MWRVTFSAYVELLLFFFLHIKTCVSSHAPSIKPQITVRFTGHYKILGSTAWNLFHALPLWCLQFGNLKNLLTIDGGYTVPCLFPEKKRILTLNVWLVLKSVVRIHRLLQTTGVCKVAGSSVRNQTLRSVFFNFMLYRPASCHKFNNIQQISHGRYIYNVYYKPLHMFRQICVIFRGFIAKVYKNFASIYMLKISHV